MYHNDRTHRQGRQINENKKMDDESGQEKERDAEEQAEADDKEHGKTTDKSEDESTNDDELGDEPTIIEFEDLVYELSQTYEMEPKYKSMTAEQEAAKVQALSRAEQVKYRELTWLHQQQADIEKKMTGVSKMIEERTKAQAPGLPIDLIERKVQVEPAKRQELHQMMKKQRTQLR